MLLAGVAVLGLGFVVAMASASVPGREDEPLLDIAWRPGTDLGGVLTWLIAIATVIGAVVLMLSVREPRLKGERKRSRAVLALVVGIILFFLAWRYLRPVAESLLEEVSEVPTDLTGPVPPTAPTSTNRIWVLGALIGLVVIAALVRLGMALRSPKVGLSTGPVLWDEPAPAQTQTLTSSPPFRGADPRGRIFGAYLDFEGAAADAGMERRPAETTGAHARRVVARFSLPQDEARALVGRHSEARFGAGEPTVADADLAERASFNLRHGMEA
jgi:Domain of unknown function (DUF4129)